eukprot:4445042-Amphidinium_carterae.1
MMWTRCLASSTPTGMASSAEGLAAEQLALRLDASTILDTQCRPSVLQRFEEPAQSPVWWHDEAHITVTLPPHIL